MDVSNVTSSLVIVPEADALPTWIIVFDHVQLALTFLGIVVNTMTLITLIKNGDGFSDVICLLLKYQAALDAIVCLFAILVFNLPNFWSLGMVGLDTIICRLWHGQYIYWAAVRIIILTEFVIAFICPAGAIFNVRMQHGRCEAGFYHQGIVVQRLFYGYAFFAFFVYFAGPCVLFAIFYGLVIHQFNQRGKASLGASGTASVIDKASNELTKTAVVVTVIFVITYSMVNVHYFLARLGLVTYTINTPLQKVDALMALLNSVVNPFVYVSFMPVYRRSVQKTFSFSCGKSGGN